MNKLFFTFFIAFILTSCGGGGGGSNNGGNTSGNISSSTSTVSLSAFKGLTVNATCILTDSNATEIVSGTTNSNGQFTTSATVPNGIIILGCYGGEYLDEVTGVSKTGTTMRAVINYTGGDVSLTTSPISEVIYSRAQALGGNVSAITIANSDIADALGLESISDNLANIRPTDINTEDLDDNSDEDKVAFILTTISQKNKDTIGSDTSVVVNDFVDSLISGTLNTTTFNLKNLINNLPASLTSKININTQTITDSIGHSDSPIPIPQITDISYGSTVFTINKDYSGFSQRPSFTPSNVRPRKYITSELPAGLVIDQNFGTISGTPTSVGVFTTTIIALVNNANSASTTIRFIIQAAVPQLANIATQTLIAGQAITPIDFSNSGGAITQCVALSSLPAGLSLSTYNQSCRLSGTPSAPSNTTTYTVRGSNVSGSATASVVLIIQALAPRLADVERTSIVTNKNITPITFVNTGGTPISCTSSANLPAGLSININLNNCVITGNTSVTITATVYTITATNSAGSDTATIRLSTHATDDLTSNEWHLNNTGQTNFARFGGVSGADINLSGVTYTGNGIIVAVIDSGLEIEHEDLVDNVVEGGSKDFVGDDTDPTNISDTTGDHGTSVTGIIAALDNNIGPKGVAPSARLKGFNYLKSQTSANRNNSLGGADYSADVSIFNQSYGKISAFTYLTGDLVGELAGLADRRISTESQDLYKSLTTNLRGGNGALAVTSANNSFGTAFIGSKRLNCNLYYSNITTYSNNLRTHDGIIRPNLTCHNANMDEYKTIVQQIVVGSTNANDKKSSFSSAGSNVWISAPGGEFGRNYPAILTTDQSGCDVGYSPNGSRSSYNSFETNTNGQNPECNYTSVFNATSAAAPVVSGVIALMLEANPSLTWRDVKHILANTARKIDANIATVTANINGANYDAEPAWTTNAAGYNFHNWYGFGRVDAAKAVSSATSYAAGSLNTLQTLTLSASGLSQSIPDNSTVGTTNTINTTQSMTVEAVQIDINITHGFTGDLAIELISPSGTRSVLLNPYSGFYLNPNLNTILLTNTFYGESITGDWTIKVIDGLNGVAGTLNSWSIIFYGH